MKSRTILGRRLWKTLFPAVGYLTLITMPVSHTNAGPYDQLKKYYSDLLEENKAHMADTLVRQHKTGVRAHMISQKFDLLVSNKFLLDVLRKEEAEYLELKSDYNSIFSRIPRDGDLLWNQMNLSRIYSLWLDQKLLKARALALEIHNVSEIPQKICKPEALAWTKQYFNPETLLVQPTISFKGGAPSYDLNLSGMKIGVTYSAGQPQSQGMGSAAVGGGVEVQLNGVTITGKPVVDGAINAIVSAGVGYAALSTGMVATTMGAAAAGGVAGVVVAAAVLTYQAISAWVSYMGMADDYNEVVSLVEAINHVNRDAVPKKPDSDDFIDKECDRIFSDKENIANHLFEGVKQANQVVEDLEFQNSDFNLRREQIDNQFHALLVQSKNEWSEELFESKIARAFEDSMLKARISSETSLRMVRETLEKAQSYRDHSRFLSARNLKVLEMKFDLESRAALIERQGLTAQDPQTRERLRKYVQKIQLIAGHSERSFDGKHKELQK